MDQFRKDLNKIKHLQALLGSLPTQVSGDNPEINYAILSISFVVRELILDMIDKEEENV